MNDIITKSVSDSFRDDAWFDNPLQTSHGVEHLKDCNDIEELQILIENHTELNYVKTSGHVDVALRKLLRICIDKIDYAEVAENVWEFMHESNGD